MIEIIIAFAVGLILVSKALSLYVAKAGKYLEESKPVWDRLYDASSALLLDKEIPGEIKKFVFASVLVAGCGCLARHALFEAIKAKFKPAPHRAETQVAMAALNALTKEQGELLRTVVLDSMLYDSLRAPLSGFILRRFVLKHLEHGRRALKSTEVVEIAVANKGFVERKAKALTPRLEEREIVPA